MDVPSHIKAPEGIELKPSEVDPSQMGAWCVSFIPKGTVYGPFVGEIVYKHNDKKVDYRFAWEVFDLEKNELSHIINATDPNKGNWMRYVNCARYLEEQNFVSVQDGEKVFYKAIKDVRPGDEMLTWFEPFKKRRKKRKNSVDTSKSQDSSKMQIKSKSPNKDKSYVRPETIATTSASSVPASASCEASDTLSIATAVPAVATLASKTVFTSSSSGNYIDSPVEILETKRQRKKKKLFDEEILLTDLVFKKKRRRRSKEEIERDAIEAALSANNKVKRKRGRKKKSEMIVVNQGNSVLETQKVVKNEDEHGFREESPVKSHLLEDLKEVDGNTVDSLESAWVYPNKQLEYQFSLRPHFGITLNGRRFYKCDICSGVYRHTFSLKRHYLRNHVNCRYLSRADITNCMILIGQQQLAILKSNDKETLKRIDENLSKFSENEIPDITKSETRDMKEGTIADENKSVTEGDESCCKIENKSAVEEDKSENSQNGKIRDISEDKDENEASESKEDKFEDNKPLMSMAGLYKCNICYQLFDDLEALKEHTKDHPVIPDLKGFACTKCHMRFTYKQNLVRHQLVHEGENGTAGSFPAKKISKSKAREKKVPVIGKPFKCPRCPMRFKYTTNLERHEATHFAARKFICSYCGKGFPSATNMKKHEHIHLGSRVPCKYCTAIFVHVGSLRKHIRLEHPDIHRQRLLKLLEKRGKLGTKAARTLQESYNKDLGTTERSGLTKSTSEYGNSADGIELVKKSKGSNFPVRQEIDSKFKFSCMICKKRFTTYVNLCRHRRLAHKDERVSSFPSIGAGKPSDELESDVVKPKRQMSRLRILMGSPKRDTEPIVFETANDPIDNSPEATANFFANVAANIAENLNSYIDGGQESIAQFKQHIRIEDYESVFTVEEEKEANKDEETEKDMLQWEKFNFPKNYDPKVLNENFVDLTELAPPAEAGKSEVVSDGIPYENKAPALCTRRRTSRDGFSSTDTSRDGLESAHFLKKEQSDQAGEGFVTNKASYEGKTEDKEIIVNNESKICINSYNRSDESKENCGKDDEQKGSNGSVCDNEIDDGNNEQKTHLCNDDKDIESHTQTVLRLPLLMTHPKVMEVKGYKNTDLDNEESNKEEIEIDRLKGTEMCKEGKEDFKDNNNQLLTAKGEDNIVEDDRRIDQNENTDQMCDSQTDTVCEQKLPDHVPIIDTECKSVADQKMENQKESKSIFCSENASETTDIVENSLSTTDNNDKAHNTDSTSAGVSMQTSFVITNITSGTDVAKLWCNESLGNSSHEDNDTPEDSQMNKELECNSNNNNLGINVSCDGNTEEDDNNSGYSSPGVYNPPLSSDSESDVASCYSKGVPADQLIKGLNLAKLQQDLQVDNNSMHLENERAVSAKRIYRSLLKLEEGESPSPQHSPLHNFDSFAFGSFGKRAYVCSVCKRHFSDGENVLRHQWKKHPLVACHTLEVEIGHDIEYLYYTEPTSVGLLGACGRALEKVMDRNNYTCTRCNGTFKNIDRLHIHIMNCAPKQSTSVESIEKTPRKRKRKFPRKYSETMDTEVKEKHNDVDELSRIYIEKLKAQKKIFMGYRKRKSVDMTSETDSNDLKVKRRRSYDIGYNPGNHVRRREMTELLDTHQCKGCGVKFKSISLLERHVRKCDGKDKFKDLKVMKSTVNESFHKKHKQTCLYCQRGFAYPKTLMNHYKAFCVIKKDKITKGTLSEAERIAEAEMVVKLKQQDEDRNESVSVHNMEEGLNHRKGWPKGLKRKSRRKNHCWTYIKKRKSSNDAPDNDGDLSETASYNSEDSPKKISELSPVTSEVFHQSGSCKSGKQNNVSNKQEMMEKTPPLKCCESETEKVEGKSHNKVKIKVEPREHTDYTVPNSNERKTKCVNKDDNSRTTDTCKEMEDHKNKNIKFEVQGPLKVEVKATGDYLIPCNTDTMSRNSDGPMVTAKPVVHITDSDVEQGMTTQKSLPSSIKVGVERKTGVSSEVSRKKKCDRKMLGGTKSEHKVSANASFSTDVHRTVDTPSSKKLSVSPYFKSLEGESQKNKVETFTKTEKKLQTSLEQSLNITTKVSPEEKSGAKIENNVPVLKCPNVKNFVSKLESPKKPKKNLLCKSEKESLTKNGKLVIKEPATKDKIVSPPNLQLLNVGGKISTEKMDMTSKTIQLKSPTEHGENMWKQPVTPEQEAVNKQVSVDQTKALKVTKNLSRKSGKLACPPHSSEDTVFKSNTKVSIGDIVRPDVTTSGKSRLNISSGDKESSKVTEEGIANTEVTDRVISIPEVREKLPSKKITLRLKLGNDQIDLDLPSLPQFQDACKLKNMQNNESTSNTEKNVGSQEKACDSNNSVCKTDTLAESNNSTAKVSTCVRPTFPKAGSSRTNYKLLTTNYVKNPVMEYRTAPSKNCAVDDAIVDSGAQTSSDGFGALAPMNNLLQLARVATDVLKGVVQPVEESEFTSFCKSDKKAEKSSLKESSPNSASLVCDSVKDSAALANVSKDVIFSVKSTNSKGSDKSDVSKTGLNVKPVMVMENKTSPKKKRVSRSPMKLKTREELLSKCGLSPHTDMFCNVTAAASGIGEKGDNSESTRRKQKSSDLSPGSDVSR